MVEKIRELCKKKGISISKLEKETGLGNGIIGKWEKFGREPKFIHLKTIADYFNVPVSYLIGEEQKEKPATPEGGGPVDWESALDRMSVDDLVRLQGEIVKKIAERGKK